MNSTPLAGSDGNGNPRDWMVGRSLACPDLQSSRLLLPRVSYDNARQMDPDVTVIAIHQDRGDRLSRNRKAAGVHARLDTRDDEMNPVSARVVR